MFKKRTFSDRQWMIGYIVIIIISLVSFILKKDTIEKQVAISSRSSTYMYGINQQLKFLKASNTTPLSKNYINELLGMLHQTPVISYDSYLQLSLQITILNVKISTLVAFQNLDNPDIFTLFLQKENQSDKDKKTFQTYQKQLFSEDNLKTITYGFSKYAKELEKLDTHFQNYSPIKLFFVKNIESNYIQTKTQKDFLFSSLLFKPENLDFIKYSLEQSILIKDETQSSDQHLLQNLAFLHKQSPQEIQKIWDKYFSSQYGNEMNHFFKVSLETSRTPYDSIKLSPSTEKEYLSNLQYWKDLSQ